MKRNNRKGFTIVELVIVIAVIAILAGVLIPTFANVVRKANISADTQLCKNMNTALVMAKAEGKSIDTMEDVLFTINEAGYVIENLNPTTEGYYYAWDSKNDLILFLKDDLTVQYPEDIELSPSDCWVTVGSQAEATTIAAAGFALYVEPDYEGNSLVLTTLTNVDAGEKLLATFSMKNADAIGDVVLRGSFGEVTLDVPKANVAQYGSIETLNVDGIANASLKVNGFIEKLTLKKGHVEIANNGSVETLVPTLAADNDAKVTNKGYINTIAAPAEGTTAKIVITNTGVVENRDEITNVEVSGDNNSEFVVAIKDKTDLISFRDSVNAGRTYLGMTVTLEADIDLAGIAWTPIGNFYRNQLDKGFMGTFDGKGHTIKNLSNSGFSVAGLKFDSNSTTPEGRVDTCYGLFGVVVNATIKNLTVTANIDMVDDGQHLGDSVAAIVGFAGGDTFNISNCTAAGSIKGFDAAGGLVGRSYAKTTTMDKCSNQANVVATRKLAGVVGFIGGACKTVNYTDCTNSGSITSTGDYQNYAAGITVVGQEITVNGVKTPKNTVTKFNS